MQNSVLDVIQNPRIHYSFKGFHSKFCFISNESRTLMLFFSKIQNKLALDLITAWLVNISLLS